MESKLDNDGIVLFRAMAMIYDVICLRAAPSNPA